MKKIFVTDGRSLAALAIARSLGEKGFEIHCGEEFKNSITSFSRYVKKNIIYPSPGNDSEQFINQILALIKSEHYEMIIPVRDETTLLFSKYKNEITKYTELYLAEYDKIRRFRDKGETIKIAREIIPCPKTYFPEEISIDEIKTLAKYPILIRSRIGSGSRGILFVESPNKFDEAYINIKKKYGEPIIQEYVIKNGYCTACILMDEKSNEIASFTYERVKEYPLSGGPTVTGVSCDNPIVKDSALRLLKSINWTGVAEVEFIIDQYGIPKLLEVNPRFWMPLHLAIKSGVDFPYLIYNLANGEKKDPILSYKIGLKYRWVLPNEILWLIKTPNKVTGIKEFVNFFDSNTCYGDLSRSDPLPIIGILFQSLNFVLDSDKRKSIFKRGW